LVLFELEKIYFRYPSHSPFHLKPVDLRVGRGDLVGFLGPNGAGKSTLLKLMVGLLRPAQGRVLFNGRDLSLIPVRERARRIAYVPQSMQFTFPLGVREIVEMGRHPYLGRFEPIGKKDRILCEKSLELCDALEFMDRSYDELSGGEKQRVLLASALAQTPEVLLLDEPTLSLDLSHQLLFFDILQRLHRSEGLTVVIATHELNLAGRSLERLVLMKEGGIVAEGASKKVLTPRNIKSVLQVEVDQVSSRGAVYFIPRKGRA